MDFQNVQINRWALLRWKANNLPAAQQPHQPAEKLKKSRKWVKFRIPAPKPQFYLGNGTLLEG